MLKRIACISMVALLGFGCGDDGDTPTPDAAPVGPDASTADAPTADAPTADAPPRTAGTCEAYCTAVTSNCQAPDNQYADKSACLDYCGNASGWEPGYEDDTGGNTIGCRTHHANAAADGEAATRCSYAGPSGANTCGNWCDVYCGTVLNNCVGDNVLYGDEAECQAACADFANTGTPGDTDGNTVQCRIYHAGAAADAPGTSCTEAGASSTACAAGLN
jgi:hypothetical protein